MAIFNLIAPSHEQALTKTQTIANSIVSRDTANIILRGIGVVPIDEVSSALMMPSDELAIYRRQKLGVPPILIDYGAARTEEKPMATILSFQPKN